MDVWWLWTVEKGRRVFARGLGCRRVAQRFLPLPFFLLLVELLAPAPLVDARLVEALAPALLEEAPLEEAALGSEEPTGVHSACLWRFQSAARHSCEQ